MADTTKVTVPVGTSTSKTVNKAAKDNWNGGTYKGDTDPKTCLDNVHNKKPIDVPVK